MNSTKGSPLGIDKNTPKLLGAAFLLQAIASLVSTFLLTPLIVPGNITASMTNIANHATQMRASIVGEMVAVSRIAAFALLHISQESVSAGHPDYLQTLGNLFYELQEFGYFLHMLPYTLGATLFYYLFYKSGFLPWVLVLWADSSPSGIHRIPV